MFNIFNKKSNVQYKHSIGAGAKGGYTLAVDVPSRQEVFDKFLSGMAFELKIGIIKCPRKRPYVRKLGAKYAKEAMVSALFKIEYMADYKGQVIVHLYQVPNQTLENIKIPYELRFKISAKSERAWLI